MSNTPKQQWSTIKKYLTIPHLLVALLITVLVIGGILDIVGGLNDSDAPSRERFIELLEIAIIPLTVALLAVYFNKRQQERDQQLADKQETQARRLAQDQAEEAALQKYFDRMSRLLVRDGLRTAPPESELRGVARVRTLTLLRRLTGTSSELSGDRKGSVLLFLYEAGLIQGEERIIDLSRARLAYARLPDGLLAQANLTRANLTGTVLASSNLEEANLSHASLNQANLANAHLTGSNLMAADLRRANLTSADLTGANLCQANLSGATLGKANLSGANLDEADLTNVDLRNVNYDQKTVWPADFDPRQARRTEDREI